MINAKNVIQETKTETETFFQKFKGLKDSYSFFAEIRAKYNNILSRVQT